MGLLKKLAVKFRLFIMCLYPRLIKNKRYNGYKIRPSDRPKIDDYRKEYVAVGCGNCIECRKQKAREWQVRLYEELKEWKYKYFVTLTFSAEELKKLCDEKKELYENVNLVAAKAVRRFLERYRKKNKVSLKHWLITELGHEGTERIHLHGIIFSNTEISKEELFKYWKYGIVDNGKYCNERTINYIIKYVTKIDLDHPTYKADIFCSAGIGKRYFENAFNIQKHKFNGKDTIQYYTLENGQKIALPKYYRNKLFTQKERDQLWTSLLDSDKTYVRGIRVNNISKPEGYTEYLSILQHQQEINTQLGYGSTDTKWNEKAYKVTFNMVNSLKPRGDSHADK